jgi:hypothetical protein
MRSFSKCVTNPKRDIVDTLFHASCAFGHNPILGLAFSYTWELESDGRQSMKVYSESCIVGVKGQVRMVTAD